MAILLHLYSLLVALPVVLKYLGIMAPDVVRLTESGDQYADAFDFATEPVYTKQKPSGEAVALAAASIYISLQDLRK